MAVTTSNDIYSVPQIGPAAVDIAFATTPLLALPEIVVDATARITDAGSETINFPYWDSSVTAQDAVRDSRTGTTPDKFSLKSASETAEAKVISVDGDRYALQDSPESYQNHLALIVGQEFGRVVQDSILEKALDPSTGTSLVHDITAEATDTLTVDEVLNSALKWTDKRSQMRGVALLLHSSQFGDIASTSDYKTLAKAPGEGIVSAAPDIAEMIVGVVHGIPLVLCDSLPNQAGLEIDTITRSSSTATVTTTAAHGLQTGELVTITGATQTEYNVTDEAITVVDATSFTYAVSGSPATPATGSPVITPRYTAALVAQGAAARFVGSEPQTERIAHSGSSVVTLDTHFRYATHLMRHNPRRVIRVVTH